MNKILLLGANGQLGTSFCKILHKNKMDFAKYDLPLADITNKNNISEIIEFEKPNIIINCAAYTDVAKAETDINKAMILNGTALKHIVDLCNEASILLCHFSTDYVFDGKSTQSYKENDYANPLNIYGLSKFVGENIIINYSSKFIIIRTAALFGTNSLDSNTNIIEKFISLGKRYKELSVVADEFTSPTYSDNLAEQALLIINNNLTGIFHATSEGFCNWYQFAEYLFSKLEMDVELKKVESKAFCKNFMKPQFSVLENEKLKQNKINIMYHWKNAVDAYIKERDFNK